jgi:hypothetical protein
MTAALNGGVLDPQKLEDSKATWNSQLLGEAPEDFTDRDTKRRILDVDTGVEREETDDEYNYRTLRVKALLFLHTFKYDYLHTELNVFSKNKRVFFTLD